MTLKASSQKKTKKRGGNISENFNQKRNNISKKIEHCNKVLIKNENLCNCRDQNGRLEKNFNNCSSKKNYDKNKCEEYKKCRKMFSNYMSNYEPQYTPENWNHPYIKESHNCYTYFLNDHIKEVAKKCKSLCLEKHKNKCPKKTKKCSNLKPQPGDWAELKGYIKTNRKYTCPDMNYKILADNLDINYSDNSAVYYKNSENINNNNINPLLNTNKPRRKSIKIQNNNQNNQNNFIIDKNNNKKKSIIFPVKFNQKCPPNHYKGALVIDSNKTYHFYRQDSNGRFSHKPGTLNVENLDASNNPIYAVHLADTDYNKNNRPNGITYDKFCSYYCVPNGDYKKTRAI